MVAELAVFSAPPVWQLFSIGPGTFVNPQASATLREKRLLVNGCVAAKPSCCPLNRACVDKPF